MTLPSPLSSIFCGGSIAGNETEITGYLSPGNRFTTQHSRFLYCIRHSISFGVGGDILKLSPL